jgi:hypothetical protein
MMRWTVSGDVVRVDVARQEGFAWRVLLFVGVSIITINGRGTFPDWAAGKRVRLAGHVEFRLGRPNFVCSGTERK